MDTNQADNTTMIFWINSGQINGNNSANVTVNPSETNIKYEAIVTSVICCIGVIGNISNITVLRMRKTRTGLDYIGKAAILGLLALACSDLMFCVVGVVIGVLSSLASGDVSTSSVVMQEITIAGFGCNLYRSACLNIFLFISTWCITLLSVERYIVVCHPFRCRQLITARSVIISRVVVSLLSVVINFPLFIRFQLKYKECDTNILCVYSVPYPSPARIPLMKFHTISWASVGTFLPLVLLLFANIRLVVKVMKVKQDNEIRRNGKAMFHVTKTLVVIAISYIVLVCPSMLLNFLRTHDLVERRTSYFVLIGNVCQAIQFSCNFLLYCTINKSFRQSLCQR